MATPDRATRSMNKVYRCLAQSIAILSVVVACNAPSISTPASNGSDASPAVAQSGPSEPPRSGISREQAIEAARAAAPRYANADVLRADSGRFEDLVSRFTAKHISPRPSPDQQVWLITLGERPSPTGGQGTDVIIDFVDGRIIFATEWVS